MESVDSVGKALRRIEGLLRELVKDAKLNQSAVVSLKVADAAKALSIGKSTLWQMIGRGEIGTRLVNGRRQVPMSEVLRIGETERAAAQSAPRASAAAQRAKFDETLRRKQAARKKRS